LRFLFFKKLDEDHTCFYRPSYFKARLCDVFDPGVPVFSTTASGAGVSLFLWHLAGDRFLNAVDGIGLLHDRAELRSPHALAAGDFQPKPYHN